MIIEEVPFNTLDWNSVIPDEQPGETGVASSRTLKMGNIRIRMIEYSPDYRADHWCRKGHVVLVLSGEVITEMRDGRRFRLAAGTSFQVADGMEAHRTISETGARMFVVD